jgi:hypothetical protein
VPKAEGGDEEEEEGAEEGAGALDLRVPSLDASDSARERDALGAELSESEADARARRFAERMHGPQGLGRASGVSRSSRASRSSARTSASAPPSLARGAEAALHPLVEGCLHLCTEAGLFGAACSREQALAIVPAFSVRSVERYVRVYREGSLGACRLLVLRGSGARGWNGLRPLCAAATARAP